MKFLILLLAMLFLNSCYTSQEEVLLNKALSLINEEHFKESFNLVEMTLFENPNNSQAHVLYRSISKKVGHHQLLKWEEDLSRDLTSIYEKLKLKIPKVVYVDKALDDVLHDLMERSIKLDPKGEGIEIFSWVNEENEIPEQPDPLDELDFSEDKTSSPEIQKISMRLVSIEADNIPIIELIKYICDQQNYRYKVKPFGVIIQNKACFPRLDVFYHTIPDGLMNTAHLDKELKSISDVGKLDWEEFLKKFDITFPPGSKIKYVEKDRKMIFVNTIENNEKLKVLIHTFKGN